MAGRALKNMLYDDGYRFLPSFSFPLSINAYVVVYWMDGWMDG